MPEPNQPAGTADEKFEGDAEQETDDKQENQPSEKEENEGNKDAKNNRQTAPETKNEKKNEPKYCIYDLPPTPRQTRINKLYRCPPTPSMDELWMKQKSFVLDNIAVSSISNDYSKANPKLGPVIRPYNAQLDPYTFNYFNNRGVDSVLNKTNQDYPGCSINGKTMDRFFSKKGAGSKILTTRNKQGAGRSRENIDGHGDFLSDPKPIFGYNGLYGFRRNTPWLRTAPSPFASTSRFNTQGNFNDLIQNFPHYHSSYFYNKKCAEKNNIRAENSTV